MAASASDPVRAARFWRDAKPKNWYGGGALFDAQIAIAFGAAVERAAKAVKQGPHPAEDEPEGALGLCILLDQFPRNIYRGLTLSWAHDPLALGVARRAVEADMDLQIEPQLRQFFYTPFMHAENVEIQAESVMIYAERLGDEGNNRHAVAHQRIIEKFGRFPARNAVLGRAMSAAETDWLAHEGYGAELNAI